MAQLGSLSVPSLIQGISQQSEQATTQASARDQRNCINDILLGARARNGTKVLGSWTGTKSDPFTHRIRRSNTEDYLVVIEDGELDIINLASGVKATVTGSIASYLAASGVARKNYAAATVEDTTFLANLGVSPQMAATLSSARGNHAIAHFKSANYVTTYKLHIRIGATTWTASYTTPDNSTAANAEFIATNRLAEEFEDAIDTLIPTITSAGYAGFSVDRRGSSLRIFGGTHDFTIWTEDGLGGQQFIAFKDRTKDIADLPTSCWDGYIVAVGAEDVAASHDYFIQYQGDEQNGEWVEVVAPSTPTTLDAATMPHVLVNTGLNAFEVQQGTWGTRLAGDGDRSAEDPYFVGDFIVDLQFIDSRLAIIGEGWYSLSRSGNAYVFFPDTVQIKLDTAPIHYRVNTGKVTLIKKGAIIGEALQFWANEMQVRLSSGQENIREDTVENKPTTFYEYDGEVAPKPFGQSSLLFGTSRGRWNNFTEVIYDGPVPAGEININGHCPKLVDGDLRDLMVGWSMRFVAALTEDLLNGVYVYQWFNNGSDRVQSSWNIWNFPASTKVLWTGMAGSLFYALISWGSTYTLEVLDTEYEGDEDEYIPLRADHRVDESYQTGTGDGYVEVTLPYPVTSDKRDEFVAYYRLDDEATEEQRGQLLSLTWVSDTVVRVSTDLASPRFWIGAGIVSYRDLPKPYLVDRNGAAILTDRLLIASIKISHTNTTTYQVQITVKGEEVVKVDEFSAREVNSPSVINNRVPVESSGEHQVSVGYDAEEASIRFVNDTIFPSSWDSLVYHYNATQRVP